MCAPGRKRECLDDLQKTVEKATPDAWYRQHSLRESNDPEPWCVTGNGGYGSVGHVAKEADADFICMARWALPMLLKDHKVMHEALDKIATNNIPPMPASWPPGTKGARPVWGAMIQVAKDALAEVDNKPSKQELLPEQDRAKLVEEIADQVVARCKSIAWASGSKCRKRCPFDGPKRK